jgi:hypothetical protein
MGPTRFTRFWFHVFGYMLWSGPIIGGIMSAGLKIDRTALKAGAWAFADPLVAWVNNWTWFILICMAVILPLAQFTRTKIGSLWVWEHLGIVLDKMQEAIHAGQHEDAVHHHRVTLFRYRTCCFCWRMPLRHHWGPWSGWLVSIARSGHTTRNHRVIFRAPDDADCAEGIAGMAWSRSHPVSVENLPLLNANSDDTEISAYATRTNISSAEVKRRLARPGPIARSFYVQQVRVKDKVWGVLVFDSISPTIPNAAAIQSAYFTLGKTLSKLLEKL